MAPLENRTSPLVAFQSTFSVARATLIRPLSPSIITLRTSSMVAPIRAKRKLPSARARRLIHSEPARVFPKPRPAMIIQTRQSPSSGFCPSCAHIGQRSSSSRRCGSVNRFRIYARSSKVRVHRNPAGSAEITASCHFIRFQCRAVLPRRAVFSG